MLDLCVVEFPTISLSLRAVLYLDSSQNTSCGLITDIVWKIYEFCPPFWDRSFTDVRLPSVFDLLDLIRILLMRREGTSLGISYSAESLLYILANASCIGFDSSRDLDSIYYETLILWTSRLSRSLWILSSDLLASTGGSIWFL